MKPAIKDQPESALINPARTKDPQPSPAELRKMFGANLRVLAGRFPYVSQLCRELGINLTQFNRYLPGESFPRPDVLHRICSFFDLDARILLEPINGRATDYSVLNHPVIADYVGTGMTDIPQDVFPDGFYRFSRLSFTEADLIIIGLVYVFRRDGHTFIRGYEAKAETG